ncbi:MAG: acyl-CoA thioester hydrolase/BAAT C-terminal domain-containing protein [Thermomicrobiales bacterium]
MPPLEYFGSAITWLQRQEGIDPSRIGLMGTSRGGEGGLLVAAHYSEITSVVSISGNGLVFADPWGEEPLPGWTWQAEDIPFVPFDTSSEDETEIAEIPVERINGPILLLAGEDDELWPAVYLSRFARNRLKEHAHPHADQFLQYPGCGHIILVPFQLVAPVVDLQFAGLMMGGTPIATATAAAWSWAAFMHHFASSLTS